jgi:methylated-DNA-[protein]-cysteine S-methyltransferase
MTTYFTTLDSPVGEIFVQGEEGFVTGLYLSNHKHWRGPPVDCRRDDRALAVAREQLAEYFAGERQVFDLPLRLVGTDFQKAVWRQLAEIPFGVSISYAELARRVGQPTATRAVGAANGRNPISIIVPCHRVIATNGKLTGYGGGLENKKWLLDHEESRLRRSDRLHFELCPATT